MQSNTNQFLFVYGSLRQGFNSPAYQYIFKYFNLVGTAHIQAKMLDKGSYPVVVPTTENYTVTGELYQIKNIQELDWAIAQLDDYEGIVPEPGETAEYARASTMVHINNDATVANIYWYIGNTDHLPIVTSGDIFEYIKSKA